MRLRGSGRTLHDAPYHHGRNAREHGLGLRGRQHVDDRVRPLRLLLRLGVATAEDLYSRGRTTGREVDSVQALQLPFCPLSIVV